MVPELDLAAEDLGEDAAVEIDLLASRVGHGVEDTDGSELEGDVVEWRDSVDGGVIDVYVAIFRVGGLEGDIASAEVVVVVFEIQLAGGRA